MKKLDFKKQLFDVHGKAVAGKTLAQVLSEIIGTETEGKSLKLYGWHRTLMTDESLEMDDSDKADLRNLIDQHKTMFVYIKGQLLEIIDAK
jgi:hypothetical protein